MALGLARHLIEHVAAAGRLGFDARGRADEMHTLVAIPQQPAVCGDGAHRVALFQPIQSQHDLCIGVSLELEQGCALEGAGDVCLPADHAKSGRVPVELRHALVARDPTRLPADHAPTAHRQCAFPVPVRQGDLAKARPPARLDAQLEVAAGAAWWHIPGALVAVGSDHTAVAQHLNAVNGVRAAHVDEDLACRGVRQDAAHLRAIARKGQPDAISCDAIDAPSPERLPQAVARQLFGQAGHQALSPVAWHVGPVVRGADRAQVQPAVERLLVGAPACAGPHVRVVAQADPFLVCLGAAVNGKQLGKRAHGVVTGRPRRCALPDIVAGVVRNGDRVHLAQAVIQLGKRLDGVYGMSLVQVDHIVIAPSRVSLPLVAGKRDKSARPVPCCGYLLKLGPLARHGVCLFERFEVHAAPAIRGGLCLGQVSALEARHLVADARSGRGQGKGRRIVGAGVEIEVRTGPGQDLVQRRILDIVLVGIVVRVSPVQRVCVVHLSLLVLARSVPHGGHPGN